MSRNIILTAAMLVVLPVYAEAPETSLRPVPRPVTAQPIDQPPSAPLFGETLLHRAKPAGTGLPRLETIELLQAIETPAMLGNITLSYPSVSKVQAGQEIARTSDAHAPEAPTARRAPRPRSHSTSTSNLGSVFSEVPQETSQPLVKNLPLLNTVELQDASQMPLALSGASSALAPFPQAEQMRDDTALAPPQDAIRPRARPIQSASGRTLSISPRPRPRPSTQPDTENVEERAHRVSALAVTRSPRPAARPRNLRRPQPTVFEPVVAVPVQPPVRGNRRGSVCGDRSIRGQSIQPIVGRISGCGIADPVRITEVDGVGLSMPANIDCVTAQALRRWVTEVVKPNVGRTGGGVASLKVLAHYSCRTRNNQPGAKISEHGRGRAVDIGAITLKDGTSITVLNGWRHRQYGPILKSLHRGACGIFGTVLGPNSDRFHQDHFHFDTARYRSGAYCR